jgi:hypothetical protein
MKPEVYPKQELMCEHEQRADFSAGGAGVSRLRLSPAIFQMLHGKNEVRRKNCIDTWGVVPQYLGSRLLTLQ